MSDVSVVVTFHAEGALAIPAIASLEDLVAHARGQGIRVEVIGVLDTPDVATRRVVDDRAAIFDGVLQIEVGDSARARSAGLDAAAGDHVAFLDGDDLWGEDWLTSAFAMARADRTGAAVLHPQFVHFFDAGDEASDGGGSFPLSTAASFVMEQPASDVAGFDLRALLINNLWTANVFAARDLLAAHPFPPNEPQSGLGIEDWSWNLATVWAGVPHRIVPGTVHMVRMKRDGSQGRANVERGLLPRLPDGASLVLPG